jgi:hypothetical protein
MPSSQEKIVEYLISRLRDKDLSVQLKTINELKALGAGASSALAALKNLYETTDDAQVRAAAKDAGLVIFRASKEAS